MTSIYQRLDAIKQHYNMSVTAIAQKLDTRKATVINYFNGSQPPKLEFIDKIFEAYPDVSAEWLMRGNGPMLLSDLDNDKTSIIRDEYEKEMLVKDGIIKELRTIILEKERRCTKSGSETTCRIIPFKK